MNPVKLPAGTTLGKSFEYGLDVNVGTTAQPVWIPFRRIFGFSMTPTPTTQDAATYDDLGATSADVTGWSFAIAFSSQVNRSVTTGEYLAEVEALRERTLPTAKGDAARIEVRWYHKPETGTPNPKDAGQGLATVSFSRSNTGADGAVEVWSWTLTGVGSYSVIENPFTGWDASTPTVSGATPTARAAGEQVTIKGFGFTDADGTPKVTGAAGVKIGGTNAASYVVVSTSTIVAVLPAGAAGPASIVVTSPEGASAAFPYTRA